MLMEHQDARCAERSVVAAVWQLLEPLLTSREAALRSSIRQLEAALPPLHSIPRGVLAELAQLHMSSSRDLGTCARLLLPGAFDDDEAADGSTGDGDADGDGGDSSTTTTTTSAASIIHSSSSSRLLQALDTADSSAVAVLSSLIELQLWHLRRAAAITAHMRAHIVQERRQQQEHE